MPARAHAKLKPTRNEVQTLKQLIWSILTVLPLGALATEVYVSVDEDGQVVYSDRPQGTEQMQVIQIGNRNGAPAPVAQPAAADTPAAEPGEEAEEGQLVFEMEREATPEERTSNCQIARERAEARNTAHRIYRELPNGEREYLSAEEIDEARAKAEADIAEWCD